MEPAEKSKATLLCQNPKARCLAMVVQFQIPLWMLPLLLVCTLGPQRVMCVGPTGSGKGPNLFEYPDCPGCPPSSSGNIPTGSSTKERGINAPSSAPSTNPFDFLTSAKFLGSPAPSPTTPYPTSNFAITPASTSSGSWDSTGNANFLIAAFFLIAAGWLFVAFLYAVLVLVVIRLRRRGPMDVHDEHFGRIYLLGSPSSSYQLFIPMGWLLRRYVMALNDRSVVTNRMSRVERRAALEVLFKDTAALKEQSLRFAKRKSASNPSHADEKDAELEANENPVFVEQGNTHVANGTILDNRPVENVDLEQQSPGGESPNLDEVASNAEPVCSICLGEYDTSEVIFDSPTCSHRFHKVCILDWLERRDNTECPCCRGDIIDEEEVWKTVTRLRRQRQNRCRRDVFFHRLQQMVPFMQGGNENPDESMETERTTEDETESPFEEDHTTARQPRPHTQLASTGSVRTILEEPPSSNHVSPVDEASSTSTEAPPHSGDSSLFEDIRASPDQLVITTNVSLDAGEAILPAPTTEQPSSSNHA